MAIADESTGEVEVQRVFFALCDFWNLPEATFEARHAVCLALAKYITEVLGAPHLGNGLTWLIEQHAEMRQGALDEAERILGS